MVVLNVSTKTGDKGKTSLADGSRLSKDNPVFEVIGTIDELNSHVGLVVSSLRKNKQKKLLQEAKFLKTVQHELFNLGGEVAGAPVKVSKEFLAEIENHSETLQKSMAKGWHHQFVLPGGHLIAAKLDIARSVCRRLERRIVSLHKKQQLPGRILQTANRLSDYLYVLRCFVNQTLGEKEQFYSRSEA